MRNTSFSVLISEVKLLLIGLRNALMDSYIYIFYIVAINVFIILFPLNSAIHRMGGQHTKYSIPDVKNKKRLISIGVFQKKSKQGG